MATNLQDMTLVVEVMVTGTVEGGSLNLDATFAMATCVPPAAPGAGPIVDSSGDIDLRCMAGGAGFTSGTDIYFILSGNVTGPEGTSYPVFFNPPASKAVTLTPHDSGVNPTIPGSGNTSVLLLDDLDINQEQYSYTLHVLAYTDPKHPATGEIDPAIINRGPGLGCP